MRLRHSRCRASCLIPAADSSSRSLNSFKELQREKADVLAEPDMLILGVGTEIYKHTSKGFEKDRSWSAVLDDGWKLDAVCSSSTPGVHAVDVL